MQVNETDVKEFLEQKIDIEDLEMVKADWFDEDYIIAASNYIFRFDSKGHRKYIQFNDTGHVVGPSVTEVIIYCLPESYYLKQWRLNLGKEKADWVSRCSANYGTFFHVLCGTILRGDSIPLDDEQLFYIMAGFYDSENYNFEDGIKWCKEEKRDIKKDLFGFVRFCQDYKVKPLAIEYPLMHPDGLYAGTVDIVCKMTIPVSKKDLKAGVEPKEIVALGDIKSGQKGFFESNEIQLISYATLWNTLMPDTPVEKVFNIGCKDYRLPLSDRIIPYTFKDQTLTQYAYKWPLFLELYHNDAANDTQTTRTKFKGVELSLESNLDVFETVDLIDRIKRGDKNE